MDDFTLEQFINRKELLRHRLELRIQLHEADKDFMLLLLDALDRAVNLLGQNNFTGMTPPQMREYVYLNKRIDYKYGNVKVKSYKCLTCKDFGEIVRTEGKPEDGTIPCHCQVKSDVPA